MSDVIELSAAREARQEKILLEQIDERLDILLSHSDVGPHARSNLKHLLAHYAKMPKPFSACVRDNMKRFGPGRTEKVCATLKDMIRGTHNWRKGEGVHASDAPELDEETEQLLLSIPDDKLERLVLEIAS